MIVASPKTVTELKDLIERHKKVLFVGCGTCVTVCLAGGEREVGLASYAVRMARKLDRNPVEIVQVTIERQCENEFIQDYIGFYFWREITNPIEWLCMIGTVVILVKTYYYKESSVAMVG